MSRVRDLMDRELDGELSALEREELDRLILSDPQLRRERRSWTRTAGALRSLPEERLAIDRTAHRIIDALPSRRGRPPLRLGLGLGSAAFAAVMASTFLFGQPKPKPPSSVEVRPLPPPPVEVDVQGDEDEHEELVTIRL